MMGARLREGSSTFRAGEADSRPYYSGGEIGDITNLRVSRISELKTRSILRLRASVGQQWPTPRGRRRTAQAPTSVSLELPVRSV